MKRLIYTILTLSLVASLAACASSKPPDLLQPAGGESIAVVDTAPDPTNNESPEPSEKPLPSEAPEKFDDGFNDDAEQAKINLDEMNLSNITADDVKKWYADIISSEFSSTSSDNDILVTETASLSSGGSISISTYGDTYYSTTFLSKDTSDEDEFYKKAADFIRIYIERGMTEAESTSLSDAISAAKGKEDIVFAGSFNFPVFVSYNDNGFSLTLS